MTEQLDGNVPVRFRLAVAMLKGGLAFGAIWMLALFALAAKIAFDLIYRGGGSG